MPGGLFSQLPHGSDADRLMGLKKRKWCAKELQQNENRISLRFIVHSVRQPHGLPAHFTGERGYFTAEMGLP